MCRVPCSLTFNPYVSLLLCLELAALPHPGPAVWGQGGSRAAGGKCDNGNGWLPVSCPIPGSRLWSPDPTAPTPDCPLASQTLVQAAPLCSFPLGFSEERERRTLCFFLRNPHPWRVRTRGGREIMGWGQCTGQESEARFRAATPRAWSPR